MSNRKKILPVGDDKTDKKVDLHANKLLDTDLKIGTNIIKPARSEYYLCTCTKCMTSAYCQRSSCQCMIRCIYGSPLYIWFTVFAFGLACAAVIVWLSISRVNLSKLNRYYDVCSSAADCDMSLGLSCAAEDNLCGCPANKTKGRCDCNSGYYWNGTRCNLLLTYGQTCVFDYNCDQSKRLWCIKNNCACKPPMFYNGNISTCDYYNYGCYSEGNATYQFRTENSLFQQNYFVEYCIGFCYRLAYTYAATYHFNDDQFCYCLNITGGYLPSNCCNWTCPGSWRMSCGSSINNKFCKVAYLAYS